MMTIDQRLDCLKAAASFMLPKLSSTEIKGAITSLSTTAELGRDNPKVRKAIEDLAMAMAEVGDLPGDRMHRFLPPRHTDGINQQGAGVRREIVWLRK